MLHQLSPLNSSSLAVTCNDAQRFPDLLDSDGKPFFFDRILADVPCSSDGTVRKTPEILKSWKSTNAFSLHVLQKKILLRGVQLLKKGGRIVYSTCSLNPLEDEAVVSAVLEQDDTVQLVSVQLDDIGLLARPGLENWKVFTQEGECDSWDNLPIKLKKDMYKSLFPSEYVGHHNLNFCRRVLPHLQDTGGFFYAVLEKIKETDPKLLRT
ncbi:RNA cytosine-C(5)-methyltransferase NSUN2-like [Octopus sinensis]|uniref:RNA cytosine-C(5)-methyltransferase NSUN2-like n=1 Tax=Octopus sinensis TaxID=2607531 RepID=A0A6P7U5C2_9MOLL|nr:RNA cytosine-C(5)-methyltransferase NSUN2-like [Octopus sinensis]